MRRRPPTSTLFPYTTLFRSIAQTTKMKCGLRMENRAISVLPCQPSRSGPWENADGSIRSEEHTSELQSRSDLVCRLLLEKKKKSKYTLVKLQYFGKILFLNP